MTHEQAMEDLKVRLQLIATGKGYTDAQTRAAMVLAITDGADRITIRDMATAVGLRLRSTS